MRLSVVAAVVTLLAPAVAHADEPAVAWPRKIVVETAAQPAAVYEATITLGGGVPYLVVTCNGAPYVKGAAQGHYPWIDNWDGAVPPTVVGAEIDTYWPGSCDGHEISVRLHVRKPDNSDVDAADIETWRVDFYEGDIDVEPPLRVLEVGAGSRSDARKR